MNSSSTIVLSVTGMSCGHCVAAVTSALRDVPGLAESHVEIGSATLTAGKDSDPAVVRAAAIRAIKQAGYQIGGESALTALNVASPDSTHKS